MHESRTMRMLLAAAVALANEAREEVLAPIAGPPSIELMLAEPTEHNTFSECAQIINMRAGGYTRFSSRERRKAQPITR